MSSGPERSRGGGGSSDVFSMWDELAGSSGSRSGRAETTRSGEERRGTDYRRAKEKSGFRKFVKSVIIAAVSVSLVVGAKTAYDKVPAVHQALEPAVTKVTQQAKSAWDSFNSALPWVDSSEEEPPAPEATTTSTPEKTTGNRVIDTADGQIEIPTHQGGYRSKNDPYAVHFDQKENESSYGIAIEGKTPAEMTNVWLERVASSPEAITRLRVQMGLENLDSLKAENEYAEKLRSMSASEYDGIANSTLGAFADAMQGGHIKVSHNWELENYMQDQESGKHDNSEVRGRLNSDDDSGEDADILLTFYDKNGHNIISSKQGYENTVRDANAEDRNIGTTAYVNVKEGGTWKWKSGGGGTETEPPEKPPVETPVPVDRLAPKDGDTEIEHAGNPGKLGLDETVTPPTTLEQDQNFDQIEEQEQRDDAARREAERRAAEQRETERRAAEEAEARRQAEEAERQRQSAEEAERQRRAAEEAEAAARRAEEAAKEAQRQAAEAERQRQEEEAARIAAQQEADRQAAEQPATNTGGAGANQRGDMFNNGGF